MQVLPPNPVLGVKGQPTGALPDNPLFAAKAKPVPAPAPAAAPAAPNDLTGIATHIATNEQFSPAFVKSLQALQQHDPTFQTRLNAEINRVSQGINAKRNSGPLAFAGNAIEGAANPLEWAKGAVEGAPQVAHGVAKIAHGNVGGGAAEAGLGALGVAGVIPGVGRAAHLAGDALKVGRTAEEADAHLMEAAHQARVEGFGGHVGAPNNPPQVDKGVATEATGGELGRQIRESLLHAPDIRNVQKAGYSEERSANVKAAAEAGIKAGGGTAGHLAEKRHLQGPLGKEFFGHLKHLTPAEVDQAHRVVDAAPLKFFEKTHARDAITNAVEHGVAATEGDQALLERVFGKVGTGEEAPPASTFWQKFGSALNVPRALRSSGDVSAGLRQGLTVLVTHPDVWRRQFGKSIRQFGSEEFYQAQQAAIHNDPLYPLMHKYGVPFTEIGTTAKGVPIGKQEEAFVGANAAEHLPLGIGKVVRASDRAFTGFQNGTRAELFKLMAEKAATLGHDLNDDHLGESIARVVGTFTGRGTLPKLAEKHFATLTATLFSPRLMASRLNMLSPVYYAKLDPFARAEALKGARNLVASIGTTMYVAKLLGADVNFDPRSSNFTKIKFGNTRIDIAGGFSQYVRLIAQEMTREAISSAGHKSTVRLPGEHVANGDISTLDNLTKFWRSKAAPVPSLAWDEASGKDFLGQPINQKHEVWSNAPFVAQDTVDAFKQSGSKAAVVDAFLSSIGLGVQSYKDKPPAGGSGGGSDGFGGSGGGFGDNSGGFGNDSGGFGG